MCTTARYMSCQLWKTLIGQKETQFSATGDANRCTQISWNISDTQQTVTNGVLQMQSFNQRQGLVYPCNMVKTNDGRPMNSLIILSDTSRDNFTRPQVPKFWRYILLDAIRTHCIHATAKRLCDPSNYHKARNQDTVPHSLPACHQAHNAESIGTCSQMTCEYE